MNVPTEFSGMGISITPERNKWVIKQQGNYWNIECNAQVKTFMEATKYKSKSPASLSIKPSNFYSF